MLAKQPASLGGFEFDAIIKRSETMTCDVPEYATEEGYSITDNIKLTTEESEAVERAYYEASSFEALMAVLCRQLNADANPETAKVIRHYAELCRAAQMKLKMVQEMVLSRYLDHQTSAGVQYRFDFVREEVVLLEATAN